MRRLVAPAVTLAGGVLAATALASGPVTGPTASGFRDDQPPIVRLTVPERLVRSLTVRSSEAADATARIRAGEVLLARGATRFAGAGTGTLVLRTTVAGRARLRRSAAVKAKLTLVVTDDATNAVAITRAVVLRRPR